jgi:hypothetical protein
VGEFQADDGLRTSVAWEPLSALESLLLGYPTRTFSTTVGIVTITVDSRRFSPAVSTSPDLSQLA